MSLKNTKAFLKKYAYVFVLVFVIILICISNYKKGTYLTGWDNHHPEFNFNLALKRDIMSVWMESRGLGGLSGMGYASELPREIILFLFSFVFPINFLRYFWQFLMLLLGPLGVYYLCFKVFLRKEENEDKRASVSFFSSLFYLFSLAMLQNFYTPLETFTTLYGFLPWLVSTALLFTFESKRKYLISFLIFSLLSAPFGFTVTLYITYLLFLFIFLMFFMLHQIAGKRSPIKLIKNSILILLSGILINSYWFFPNVYFVLTGGEDISEATINKLSSQKTFLKNKAWGSLGDLSLLKGYSFDTTSYDLDKEEYTLIYSTWIDHLNNPLVLTSGYLLFAVVLLGLVCCLRRRKRDDILFALLFLVSAFFLLNDNPPFGFIFSLFQKYIPFFREAFRSPYTKYSIQALLSYTLLFFVGYSFLYDLFSRKRVLKILSYTSLVSIFIVWMFPLFTGSLFLNRLRLTIPQDYFDFFTWSNNQSSEKRVLYMPINDFWSWRYHTWGYIGSGFMRHGIKQPLLDRSFDVWNTENENSYWEISTTFYSKDFNKFKLALDKFNISYLVLDKSVFVPDVSSDAVSIISSLENDSDFSKVKEFGDNLVVFEYNNSRKLLSSYSGGFSVNKIPGRMYEDVIYQEFKPYFESTEENPDIWYLFPSWFDANKINSEYVAESDKIYFTSEVTDISGLLKIPSEEYLKEELMPLSLNYTFNNGILEVYGGIEFPQVIVNDTVTWDPSEKSILLSYTTPLDNVVLFFNSRYLGTLKNNTSGVLGKYYINPSEEAKLSLYDLASSEDLTDVVSNSSLELCGERNLERYSLAIEKDKSLYFSMLGDGFCATTPEVTLSKGNYLISLKRSTPINIYTQSCLLSANEDCLEKKILARSQNSNSTENLLSGVSINEDGKYSFQIYFNSYNPLEESSIYINSFNLVRLDLLKQNDLIFNHLFKTTLIDIKGGDTVKVSIPTYSGDPLYSLEAFKEPTLVTNSTYQMYGDYMPERYSYLGQVYVNALEGSYPYIYFSSKSTNRRDAVLSLSNDYGVWVKKNIVKPPLTSSNEVGYRVGIYNDEVSGIQSSTYYKDLKISPFPYLFLKNLMITTNYGLDSKKFKENSASYEHSRPYVFSNVVVNGKLLAMDEAYEIGWVVFCGITPCGEHVRVNNWSNGWLFKGNIPDKVNIVFLPQYLEYCGFVLVFVLFIWSIRRKM